MNDASGDKGGDKSAATPSRGGDAELARNLAGIAERSQRLVADFLGRQSGNEGIGLGDPAAIGAAFFELTSRMMADPAKLVQAQMALWNDYLTLWQRTAERMMGKPAEPVIAAAAEDRRFRDREWNDNAVFDYIKQSYLLAARYIQSAVKETGGESLVNGLKNLLDDLERGKGRLAISMTDMAAFKLGENVAATPGKVVYQNALIQLLQYAPTTETVKRRPLLIIPPWINKFYVLDLRPRNSFIRWAVEQGHTVFVISWVNPDEHLVAKSFDDYMFEGPIAALEAMQQATGERNANGIGYCLSGSLPSPTAAIIHG